MIYVKNRTGFRRLVLGSNNRYKTEEKLLKSRLQLKPASVSSSAVMFLGMNAV